ncbi:uncharacterized protein HMPREF1120_06374 [Exophiala dermatitidis NIH/UT8656]|uniref:Uncharacterized protein n=1 Tax=Exophiala dermatitidis (strain ATCC 34100 / CBS 525.76 / NIH/UT8656) TaxID=858893 RepID=H6C3Z7_EXODN|nr:uncharacterized protein HMPREF1120_06374 [Exophiala dermatitidis NIH/UT8656]EHY58362.1 hypothetical protein HMPREF1120_06374 [Exophiala dermatitidis NIH/UT8656]
MTRLVGLGALRVPNVSQPCATVELGINLANLARWSDGESVDTLHLVLTRSYPLSNPAPGNLVASVEDVERSHRWNWWLRSLTCEEGRLAGECHAADLFNY